VRTADHPAGVFIANLKAGHPALLVSIQLK
jgi:hypothetical protein